MRLHFPNPSRSFDEDHKRVLFWGYDSAIEVSFSLEADALKQLDPTMENSEKSILKAFDTAREHIYKVADKVYVRAGKGVYAHLLTAKEF